MIVAVPALAPYAPWIGLAALIALFVLFARESVAPVVLAIVGAVAMMILGFISPKELLAVFSNSAPIAIGATARSCRRPRRFQAGRGGPRSWRR